MKKSSFFIVGKHPVIEALKNPKRKVLRIFLTEEAKKTIHRTQSSRKNLLKDLKVFLKQKKNLISIPLKTAFYIKDLLLKLNTWMKFF